MSRWSDPFYLALQKICPQHALSLLAGKLATQARPWLAQPLIRAFIHYYQVDLSQADRTKPSDYLSFQDFFTRSAIASHPIDTAPGFCSPVDGTLSALGRIQTGEFCEAKGHAFNLKSLLGGHPIETSFREGSFLTAYLGPPDYHRIHCPMDATLETMIAVPGRLYAVNPTTTRLMPGVLARNERVINVFRTQHGRMAVVMIGAMIVGSIQTSWAGCVRERRLTSFDYSDKLMQFQKGDELGQFGLGSCVMVLFESGDVRFDQACQVGHRLTMGHNIGSFHDSTQ